MIRADWIAADWGTSHLRVWAMQGERPIAEASSARGMGTLAPAEFEAALLELVEDWLGDGATPVLACGMVGARQGWVEAPYLPVPTSPGAGAISVPARDPRLSVHILPGLSQPSPPDVMRGEETQIAGYLSSRPQWDGVLCLPGTHSKWVHASAGEVISFRTFLTGEMFALLCDHSVLRHSLSTDGFDDAAFAEALSDAMSRPAELGARLFGLRAADLLTGATPAQTRARLSGLLIGVELAAARPFWLGREIVVIGAETTAPLYQRALSELGATCTRADVTEMTLAGLVAARRKLQEPT